MTPADSHLASPRELLISGNWKMHHNHYEAIQFVQKLAAILRGIAGARRPGGVVAPAVHVAPLGQTAVESDAVPVALGAQTCHVEDRGCATRAR